LGTFFVAEVSTAVPVDGPDVVAGLADPAGVPPAPAPAVGVADPGEDADAEAEPEAEAAADPDADAEAEAEADAEAPAVGVAVAAPDAGPSPALLTAVTVNEYVVPLDRFFTVAPGPLTETVFLPPW
jgi:hypothetical protein